MSRWASRTLTFGLLWTGWPVVRTRRWASRSRRDPTQLEQCLFDRGHRLEGGLADHRLGELDAECLLESQHQADAGMGGHAGLEQVGVVVDCLDRNRQPCMLLDDSSDLLPHLNSSSLVGGPHCPWLLG